MKSTRTVARCVVLGCLTTFMGFPAFADELATISGRITDPHGLVVGGAKIDATNINTNITYSGETNADGLYRIPSIPPGAYRVIVQKTGFAQIVKPGVDLHVQDIITLNFTMQVGSVSQSITVAGGAPMVNTTDASVSTVIDRRFVENMPLNGRSFQTLISLTPGVVTTPTSFAEQGQFSVNGQRADANYFMVDGVSANIGTSSGSGLIQSTGGALPAFSALGSTNTLVSVDAMQEFRIQTSTFAPEFGRTPGAQISIVTRSGTNQFHGTAFDFFRNDALDAKDWFVNHNKLPKPRERQNDFGGVFGGPIIKDNTFFFFSYEGLRLRLPSTQTTFVPDLNSRQSAPPAVQPLLNAFPLPNGPEVGAGVAQSNASFSNPASLDAYSTRIDHRITSRSRLFGRYDYGPSELTTRGAASLAIVQNAPATTHTLTVGLTSVLSTTISNELRTNYSNARAGTAFVNDTFGGAVPLTSSSLQLPPGATLKNSLFVNSFLGVNGLGLLLVGMTCPPKTVPV